MGHVVLTSELNIKPISANKFSGELLLKTTEILKLKAINASVFFNAKGRMSSRQDKVLEMTIPLATFSLVSHTNNFFSFEFELPENSTATYEGKNVSFYYTCNVDLVFEEDSYDSLEKSVFRKMISFVSSNTEINITKNFDFSKENKKLEVLADEYGFKLNANRSISFTVIGLMALLYGFYIYKNGTNYFAIWHIPIGIISTGLIIALATFLIGKYMGKIKMKLSSSRRDDEFSCTLYVPFSFNMRNSKIYYQVIEQVIDSRGSSSTTHKEVLFESKSHDVYMQKNAQQIVFNFPNQFVLPSVSIGGAAIQWKMFITGKKNGSTYKFSSDFKVKNN